MTMTLRLLFTGMAVVLAACGAAPPADSAAPVSAPPVVTALEPSPPRVVDEVPPVEREQPEPAAAHRHHHAAPRGGTLVELGDEFTLRIEGG